MHLQVLILSDHASSDDVDDDVSFTDIDQHVVLEHDGVLLAYKDAIADAQVLDKVGILVDVIHDLEVTSAVLLSRLLVLVGNHEVVDHALNSSLLRVQITLVLLDALLATEENEAIAQVLVLAPICPRQVIIACGIRGW